MLKKLKLKRRNPERDEPEVVEIDLDSHHEAAWDRLPSAQRIQAVKRLQEIIPADVLQEIYEAREDPWFHFSTGMAIRNVLRSDHGLDPRPKNAPIRDAELPDLADLYGDQGEARNWDDYYVQVLEACVGKRDLD